MPRVEWSLTLRRMARNRTRPVEGEFSPAPSPEGPIAKELREGVEQYIKREGGLALIEQAARGALNPAALALIKLGLDLETLRGDSAPQVAKRILSAVPKTVLDGPLPTLPHVRQ